MPLGRKEYPDDWEMISALIRFVIAKNRCEKCKGENYQHHPDTGSIVILTVAHLDHNRQNNTLDNLQALCQRCHLSHDKKHHLRNSRLTRLRKEGQELMFE